MPFCKKCGYEIYSDDQFCYRCGAPMGPTPKRVKARAPAKPQPITPTETAPVHEIPTEAPKKAGKFRLRWLVISVAAVVVVGLGIAAWWWFAGSAPEKLVFKDDFGNTGSGWWVSSGDWGSTGYSNGELKMQRKTAGWGYADNENIGRQTDFIVEVAARKIPEGEDTTDCSILFRLQDNNNLYGFYVQPRGKYSVWKRVEGKWTVLIDWAESDYIKTGTSTNKLKVVCQGQKMDFYINGHKVNTIKDNTFVSGQIALSVYSEESTPTTEYRFDNFRVYALKTPVEKEPSGKPLFEDDFSSSNSGWWVGSGDWGGVAYSNGELVMYRKEGGNWTYTTNENISQQTDFAVEVDARKIPEGMDFNYCGILFRFQDADNYYGFFVNSKGEYDIGKSVSGQFSKLKDWTRSDYIKTGTSTNKLKVVCKGTTIEVYANGHKLATVEDNSLSAGEIALEVFTNESTPTTEYRFDNLKLYPAGALGETSVTEPTASEATSAEEAASEGTSTESTGEWLLYSSDAFGFSVEYPSSWSLNTFMEFLGTVLITEPGGKAVISTSVLPVGSVILDDLVSGITDYQKQNDFYYELISNNPVTHQGISARIVECVYQEEAEKPRYRSSQLFTIVDGMKYSIELRVTPPADYGSYSQLFQKVMASFHVP